ncbi:chemotaxis protein CheW [Clostridium sp.]|uniref:chemotaxis protein CheW n=1 Tax=Clostridium sp. TaxID=1506 RepID=UPI001D9FD5E1|nr:chemotaxis protein CheW [Clostridium sp.]MBS5986360.1 purine-binding chemotaxis protein CheW [Clostridium sp.]
MDNIESKILIFRLGEELYSTNISEIERILEYTETVHIPDSPNFVEGVINYEGHVIPIINLCKKFNLDCCNNDFKDFKIIVVKRENRKFGVIVNNVYEVSNVSNEMVEKVPSITLSENNNYIKGLVKIDGKIIILLDMERILSKEDSDQIF